MRIPNELKLMFADCLDLDDIITLVHTTRDLNRLLTLYMYRRAKDLKSRYFGRPYFLRAVDAGNLTAVRHFIEVGTSVNMSDPKSFMFSTALHSCVWEGYIELAQLLIQHGVNMSPVSNFGETPLHLAIGKESEETWVRLLADAGTDISASYAHGRTILSWAASRGNASTVQLLLERGANPAFRNHIGDTLLHCPDDGGSAAKLRLFLEAGLNIEATNQFDERPLHRAAKFDRKDYVIELLQRGANVEAIDNKGRTPLQAFLSFRGSTSAARHILHHQTLPEECASKGSQACVPGCLFGESDEPVVDLLLSAGADIRAGSYFSITPLYWAASLLNKRISNRNRSRPL
jgi:ankyrin repeat protein